MAYIEVRHDMKVVAQFPVPEEKAGQECVVHVGKTGQVALSPGECKTVDGYTIAFRQGPLPEGIFLDSEQDAHSVQSDPSGGKMTNADGACPFPVIEGYQIMRCIGRGAMGSVWKAVQLSTRREVAIKFLSQHCLISSKSRRRFEREVQLAACLNHPHITHVYDSGLYEGRYYYTMEYIEGLHLDQYVVQNRLETQQIIELFITICMAVEYAHQKRIVHRDLKPANILVSADGQPHILDFGLAMTDYQEDTFAVSVSLEGETAGTLVYMSPEQAGGRTQDIGPASDVYSLGVILYKLLTGRFPRDMDGGYYEILRRIVEEPIIPAARVKAIAPALDQILTQALSQKPEHRPATAGALGQQLGAWLSGGQVLPCPTVQQPVRRRNFAMWLWMAAIIGILAGGGLLSYNLWTKSASVIMKSSPEKQSVSQQTLRAADELTPELSGSSADKSDEYNASQCLQRIDRLMTQKEYLPAKIALSQFREQYPQGETARQYDSRIVEWKETIDAMLPEKNIEDHIHYLAAPFALTSEVWKTASQRVGAVQNRFARRQRLVVLRILLDDETLENTFLMETDFSILAASGGMSFAKTSRYCGQAGEVLILAEDSRPFDEPKQKGSLSIRSLHHYPVQIDIPLAANNPLYYGDILIRRLPAEVKGQLAIQVEAQSNIPLGKTKACLENGLCDVPVDASGRCEMTIAAGTYTVRAECQKDYESTIQTIEVRPQEKTELRLSVHRVQEAAFKWRFYDYQNSQMHTGQGIVRTGKSWAPQQEWGDIFYPVIQLTPWDGKGCWVSSAHGSLQALESPGDIDAVPLPMHLAESATQESYPLSKGATYAWYRYLPGERYEALIQIEDIRNARE